MIFMSVRGWGCWWPRTCCGSARSSSQNSDRRWSVMRWRRALLVVGGYLLVAELPRALANADRDRCWRLQHHGDVRAWHGAVSTRDRAGAGLSAVPEHQGQVILPYRLFPALHHAVCRHVDCVRHPDLLAPPVVTGEPACWMSFGIPAQKWLLEPTGIFQLMFGADVPDVAGRAEPGAGRHHALHAPGRILATTTVVFLAGLGNISHELYEAARIDGAGDMVRCSATSRCRCCRRRRFSCR